MEFCAVKNIKQKDTENLENLLKHFTPKISEKVLGYHKSLPNYKDSNAGFEEARAKSLPESVLVSATDGNHGFGLAHVGNLFNMKVKIFMPVGTELERAERIRRLGANVDILDVNYDSCVIVAKQYAVDQQGLFVQDTALETDSEEELKIPLYIMQGYMSILQEAFEQIPLMRPTHILLQCGVGSFASSLAAFIQNKFRDEVELPILIGVEPTEADCFFRSTQTGELELVTGEMNSIMAGLCCGVPSTLAYPILRYYVSRVTLKPARNTTLLVDK